MAQFWGTCLARNYFLGTYAPATPGNPSETLPGQHGLSDWMEGSGCSEETSWSHKNV